MEKSQNAAPESSFYQSCPHFAVANDPTTGLLFPSKMGHCYSTAPSTAVSLDHQQQFCLTNSHSRCPIYQQPAAPVITTLHRHHPTATTPDTRRPWWLLVLLLLLAGVWQGWRIWPTAEPEPTVAAVVVLPSATPTATATPTPPSPPTTAVPSPTPTILPTATPPPTAVPSATATPSATAVPQPQAIVNVERLNVRSGPSTEYPILLVAEAGDTFTVVGSVSARDWWQVCCVNEELAWLFAGSVTFEGNETAVLPAVNIPAIPTATE